MKSFKEIVKESAVPKDVIDIFLDLEQPSWAQFDPVVGYTLYKDNPRDGIDGSSTISTAGKTGARTSHIYNSKPCRINTYGNSFTQCHQVSDGETWQEYLAAHLGEPIRNFGMGGFGVYQAYRRLVQIEKSDLSAENIIFYIWGDDHTRSLMRCRHAATRSWLRNKPPQMFHGNFWAHVEMDLSSKTLIEKENPLSTPESLYQMTKPEFMYEALKDDLILQLIFADKVNPESLDMDKLNSLAQILEVKCLDSSSAERFKETLSNLIHAYSFAATKYILKKIVKFCSAMGKKLIVSLLCPTVTRQLLDGLPRYDQEIVDFLHDEDIDFFDMNVVHINDYKDFNLSVEDYMKRYYIGHYNPAGNHFFAFSIKDKIVESLDPKPITYSNSDDNKIIDFSGYLPDTDN